MSEDFKYQEKPGIDEGMDGSEIIRDFVTLGHQGALTNKKHERESETRLGSGLSLRVSLAS